MNRPSYLVLAALMLFAVSVAAAPDDQKHMRAAIEMLQSAKTASDPLPLLKSAKKHVANAKPNKGGERRQAVESINEAIAQATVGDKAKMEQKVNAAIAAIHSGMGKAR